VHIHQEIDIKAAPGRIYKALTDAKQFSALTGNAPTEISSEEGGPFSVFGGMIVGRNIELVPDRRIVQTWRVKTWEPGVYSTVRFELRPEGAGTRIVFDHTGFPEEERAHLESGWHSNYWEPLQKSLA
jgi:activator of HSP90 ATPase